MDFKKDILRKEKTDSPGSSQKKNETGIQRSKQTEIEKKTSNNTVKNTQKSVAKGASERSQKGVAKSTSAGTQKGVAKSTSAGKQKSVTKSTSKSVQKGESGNAIKGAARTGKKASERKSSRKKGKNWKKTVIFIAVGLCILLLLLAGILFFRGCGGLKLEDATQSTVTVARNGEVSQLLIEAFPTEQYSDTDLKDTVTQWITEYTQQHDKNAVVLENLEVKEEIAKLRIGYASAEDYKAFNQVDFFAGTVEEAIAAGYEFPNVFLNKDKEEVSFTKIRSSCLEEKVIIIQEPLNVLAPDTILYTSSNMEILDDQNAKLESDTMITYENGQTVTENYGFVIYNSK